MCCFYQYYYTCINMSKIKRKPRTSWQRDRYLWVLNAAVYLRDVNTQFVWFYFAKSLRTLSPFWRKRFSLKNIFTFAWTGSDRLRDWIYEWYFVFLTLHSHFSSQFIRVRQLQWFIKETVWIFENIKYFPKETANNKERPLVLQSLIDIWQNMITYCTLVSPTILQICS